MNKKIVCIILIACIFLNITYIKGASSEEASLEVNAISSGTVVVSNTDSEGEEKELWSKKQICSFIRGCWEDRECYPFGYIKEEKYCGIYYIQSSIERFGFINQSESEENCIYDFQCKSNFCLNQRCTNSIEATVLELNNKIKDIELSIGEIAKENNASLNNSYSEKNIDNRKEGNWFNKIWENIFDS